MMDQNNQSGSPETKLVFETMHDQSQQTESSRPQAQTSQPPRPVADPLKTNPPKPAGPGMAERMREMEMGATNFLHNPILIRYIIFIIVVIALGVGGYFGYKWYTNRASEAEETIADNTEAMAEEPKLPIAWVQQYFFTNLCADEALCGENADPDGDSLTNMKEYEASTSPLLPDTDFDGLSDPDELNIFSTDPIVADSDGDGFEDGSEVRNGYNPNLATAAPASTLEVQVFEENRQKYGLHAPTNIFLLMESFSTTYTLGESIGKLSLSKPAGWTPEELPEKIVLRSPDSLAMIEIVPFGTASSLQEYAMSVNQDLTQDSTVALSEVAENMVAGQKQFITEYVKTDSSAEVPTQTTISRVFMGGNGLVFNIILSSPTTEWLKFSPSYQVIENSIRIGK